jgi:FkbM family methyltransferase
MAVESLSGAIVNFSDFNHRFSFFVHRETDLIQSHHKRGFLYEREELSIIQKYAQGAGAFLDIGANVGNHAIFIAKVLRAPKVFVFEANPFTANILKINISLNALQDTISAAHVGMGLGSKIDSLNVIYPFSDNLGAARLASSGESHSTMNYPTFNVPVLPLDSLAIPTTDRFGFIKLDVEGMELEVLHGAAKFIADYRPAMFVEVDNHNAVGFHEWAETNRYRIVDRYKRYPSNENFLIVSID